MISIGDNNVKHRAGDDAYVFYQIGLLLARLFLIVVIGGFLFQGGLRDIHKGLKLVFEMLPFLAATYFFINYRLRMQSCTQAVYVLLLIVLTTSFVLSSFNSVAGIFPLQHLLLDIIGELPNFCAYFLVYLLFSRYGEASIAKLLKWLLVANFIAQLVQAVTNYGQDSQIGLLGKYSANHNAFILALIFMLLLPREKDKEIILLLTMALVGHVLSFGMAALLIAAFTIVSYYIVCSIFKSRRQFNFIRKLKLFITISVVIVSMGFMLPHLLNIQTNFFEFISAGLFDPNLGGYLSENGLVPSHLKAILNVYSQPEINQLFGSGPATWGSRAAGQLNEAFNSRFIPQWRLEGDSYFGNIGLSGSSLATFFVETGLLGGITYFLFFPIVIIIHLRDFGRILKRADATVLRKVEGLRLALLYMLVSYPYLVINTPFNEGFSCAFFAAFLGYVDWYKRHIPTMKCKLPTIPVMACREIS